MRKLSESVMTGLLIQVKRREKKGSVIKSAVNQEELVFFPTPTDSTADAHPYVTLVVEVGVQLPISQAATTHAKIRKEIINIESAPNPVRKQTTVGTSTISTTEPEFLHLPVQPNTINHAREVHPRYSIFSYSCSVKVHSVITESDRPIYKSLLGNHDILDEHPRTDDDSLFAVRTMKPFWSALRGRQDDFLQKSQEWDDDDGGAVVRKYEDVMIDYRQDVTSDHKYVVMIFAL
jgi:hypothetical protein